MMATGTLTDPLTLTEALTRKSARPGKDAFKLSAGTYSLSDLTATLAGLSGKIIHVYADYEDRAIINVGTNLTLGGGYVRFENVEFDSTQGWTDGRESMETVDDPSDLTIPKICYPAGAGLEFINCHFRNGRNGLGWFGKGGLLYGCLIYHNGWKLPSENALGHGVYPQNTSGAKIIKDCVIFDNFGWGIHAYSGTPEKLAGIQTIGNTCFCNGSLSGLSFANLQIGGAADVVTTDPVVRENMTYQPNAASQSNIGYLGGATGVVFVDNYIQEHMETTGCTFAEQAGNYDGPDVGNAVFVRANEYRISRANLTIYNEAEADTVNVDLTALGWTGQVTARNVQDYFMDVQTLDIVDGAIVVNMQAANRTVATPVQWTAPATTFPTFGAFVLERIP